ncbi:MAG: hypothetical protein M1813_002808 [Trichoglossum hirsutum]|nr:MAG: hypothetical protein M1813_002808 [Trichoglossum hirsutum]
MTTINDGNIPTIKVERDDGASAGLGELKVKSDPDSTGASPSAMSEDDIYEDAGDLDFSAGEGKSVWLMRIPKFLWDSWEKISDDEEVELGRVRVEQGGDGNDKLSLLLSSSLEQNKGLPREYNMQITNFQAGNTYIFTEKDLPGYTSKSKTKPKVGLEDLNSKFPPIPTRLLQVERDRRGGPPKWEKGKRWQPYFRKAIPKQTAMVGTVKHEVNCLPVENEEYERLMQARTAESMKPKRETKFLEGNISVTGGNLLAPGTLGDAGNFQKFIKTGTAARGKGPQELKAARMPQNELLDLIFDCFKRYNYWSLKSLKSELNQPEAYLKSTLEKVAVLVKSGRFAMTWTLKPEVKVNGYAEVKNEQAPDSGIDGPSDVVGDGEDDVVITIDDDEEDNEVMEDVLPA